MTPNIPEAEILTKQTIRTKEDMMSAAKIISDLGCKTILLKGGHLDGEPNDLFFDGQHFHWLEGKRIRTKNTHGTGCTLSSAIAAHLAKGATMFEAVHLAKRYITTAIQHSLALGQGHGPTHHFYDLYRQAQLNTQ